MKDFNVLLLNGHGWNYNVTPAEYDCGATGNGYKEAELTREFTDIIQEKLSKYVNVLRYPRDRNAFADIQAGTFRSVLLEYFGTDDFDYAFEDHFNAFKKDELKDGLLKGTECYVTWSENGISVEQGIMNNLSEFFPLRDNDNIHDGVKRANFLVINTLKSWGISGALLETCFIDDADDMATYQEHKYALADAVVKGIVEKHGIPYDDTPSVMPEPPKQEERPIAPAKEKYGVGTAVCTNTLSTQANNGKVYSGDWNGVIGRVIDGASYPYRVDKNGIAIGWTNDTGIDSDPHVPGGGNGKPSSAKKLYLPSTAERWRIYDVNVAPVVANTKGFLYPSKFGGLEYEVLGYPYPNVVTIKTRDYGKVNIYVGKETGAVIK